MRRKTLSHGLGRAIIFLSLWLSVAAFANAQEAYPTREIVSVIPFAAGGGTDLACRALGAVAQKHFGQPWVPINKLGSMGVAAAHFTAQEKPDGYTIAHLGAPPFSTVPYMFDVPFDPSSLKPVIGWAEYAFFMAVRTDAPWKTLSELVDHIRTHPGLKYSHSGPGNSTHLFMESFAKAARIKITGVPFKGDADQSTALLGGHVSLACGSPGLKPMVDAGKFRILTMFNKERVKNYDAPTIRELGYDLGLYSPYMGIYVHKDTPEPIVKKIHDLTKKAMADPKFIDAMDNIGMGVSYLSTQALWERHNKEIENSQGLLKELGLLKKGKK